MADGPGTLFVVATPIGNLEDVTLRALRTLREVDLIAAEDTRRTSKLLARYDVRKPLLSLREHNEIRETPRLVARLSAGASIALVSDAGTPGISDPGSRLVRAVREAGLRVVPVPGPSAITAALSASGLPADQFLFLGYPPSSGRARTDWLRRLAEEPLTVVFFEAPHRIARTVGDVCKVKQPIIIHHEISKLHEFSVVWPTTTEGASVEERGEFTVVVPPARTMAGQLHEASIIETYNTLTSGVPLTREQALTITAQAHGTEPSTVKKIVKKASILAKQQNRHAP